MNVQEWSRESGTNFMKYDRHALNCEDRRQFVVATSVFHPCSLSFLCQRLTKCIGKIALFILVTYAPR